MGSSSLDILFGKHICMKKKKKEKKKAKKARLLTVPMCERNLEILVLFEDL
jgi:hypothetical protein